MDNPGGDVQMECRQNRRRNCTPWECNTAAVGDALDVQLQELSEHKLIDVNEERDCNEKNEYVTEEMTMAKKKKLLGTTS